MRGDLPMQKRFPCRALWNVDLLPGVRFGEAMSSPASRPFGHRKVGASSKHDGNAERYGEGEVSVHPQRREQKQ
jgi:hypothetical protein